MKLRPEDVRITPWPLIPEKQLDLGRLPKGVHVTHIPTGTEIKLDVYREHHKNKNAAIAALGLLVEDA